MKGQRTGTMEPKNTNFTNTSATDRMSVIGKLSNMLWLRNNRKLSGRIEPSQKNRGNKELHENHEMVTSVLNSNEITKDTSENSGIVSDTSTFIKENIDRVWNKHAYITDPSLPDDQMAVLQKLDEAEMLSIAIGKSLVTAKLETIIRLNDQEEVVCIESYNESAKCGKVCQDLSNLPKKQEETDRPKNENSENYNVYIEKQSESDINVRTLKQDSEINEDSCGFKLENKSVNPYETTDTCDIQDDLERAKSQLYSVEELSVKSETIETLTKEDESDKKSNINEDCKSERSDSLESDLLPSTKKTFQVQSKKIMVRKKCNVNYNDNTNIYDNRARIYTRNSLPKQHPKKYNQEQYAYNNSWSLQNRQIENKTEKLHIIERKHLQRYSVKNNNHNFSNRQSNSEFSHYLQQKRDDKYKSSPQALTQKALNDDISTSNTLTTRRTYVYPVRSNESCNTEILSNKSTYASHDAYISQNMQPSNSMPSNVENSNKLQDYSSSSTSDKNQVETTPLYFSQNTVPPRYSRFNVPMPNVPHLEPVIVTNCSYAYSDSFNATHEANNLSYQMPSLPCVYAHNWYQPCYTYGTLLSQDSHHHHHNSLHKQPMQLRNASHCETSFRISQFMMHPIAYQPQQMAMYNTKSKTCTNNCDTNVENCSLSNEITAANKITTDLQTILNIKEERKCTDLNDTECNIPPMVSPKACMLYRDGLH